ncbi:MAG: alpha/beta hydrolase [Nitrospinota bacterium]
MVRNRGTQQSWVMDAFLASGGGWSILHPEAEGIFEELGYNHTDIVRVVSRTKAAKMFPKAWSLTAAEVARKANNYEERGFCLAARDLYRRAAQLYGRAQYGYFFDHPLKTHFHVQMVQCYEKCARFNPTPVERVQFLAEGKTVYAVYHGTGSSGKSPACLLFPGMDMFKEDWHTMAQNYLVPRGIACLAMDGPGQGETLLHGYKVNATNYAHAIRAGLDWLQGRPEVDGDKLAGYGLSMGSYWGTLAAATDDRLKAVATTLGCYGDMEVIFNQSQPNFKANFMWMAGYSDEKKFDEEVASKMHSRETAPKIKCPFLMAHGEFDELTPLVDALKTYNLLKCPKEIWIFDNEFHPLGGVANELLGGVGDWLLKMLKGDYASDMDNRLWIGRDGNVVMGDCQPAWWDGAFSI